MLAALFRGYDARRRDPACVDVRMHLASLEQAVAHMTDIPARYLGLVGRGQIAKGFHADLVVFDPDTIGADELRLRHDLPGQSPRLYSGAEGIHKVFVNGALTVDGGEVTGSLPGVVLRSGSYTETVPIPAGS